MFGNFPTLKLSTKLPALIVCAAITLAVGVGVTSITTATKNAEHEHTEKLRALLAERATALGFYLDSIKQDIISVAASPFTIGALTDFSTAWTMLEADQTGILQRAYIEENPHPIGEKEKLDRAEAEDYYHVIHEKYHSWFRTFLRQRDYYDIFIFDLDGNLIYTVFKELDYATNLNSGQWKDSDLGNAFRAARDSKEQGSLHFFDFEAYAPSHGAAASFLSTPLFDEEGEKVGVLAFQMPIARINAVMGGRSGLGETGETFIVGQDGLMRSDSPFSESSTILKTRVENSAIASALAGVEAVTETHDYRNMALEVEALPFTFLNAKWALVAAMGLDEMRAPDRAMRNQIILVSFVLLVVVAAIGVFVARGITKPLTGIVNSMNKLAAGDADIAIAADTRSDEVGDMLRAVAVFRDNAIEAQRLERENAEQQQKTEAEKKVMMRGLADSFSTSVGAIVDAVSSASSQLQTTAENMGNISEQTSVRAASVLSASEEASANVQTVAAATEEMSNSIEEITRRVVQSAATSKKAMEEVAETRTQMSALANVADKIGGVVSMISDIAEQTNLLALNATIESARAGEAGRGFAVVANEVKDLATQTAKATGEIADQIQDMQSATNHAVTSMESISEVISAVEETSTTIAAAMEEQGAATREIASSVQEVVSGTRTVSEDISDVTNASEEAGQAAEQVMSATNELFEQSGNLKNEVSDFLCRLREGDADRRVHKDPDFGGPERRQCKADA